jgi:hypothetical protein
LDQTCVKLRKWSNSITRWICSKVWHPTNSGLQFTLVVPTFRFSVNSYPIIITIQVVKHVQFLTYHDFQNTPNLLLACNHGQNEPPMPKLTSLNRMGCVFSFCSQPCVNQHSTKINIFVLLTSTFFLIFFFSIRTPYYPPI